MSLRLRLLLSLLALAAVGLVIVDAVSYSSLRSHLSRRVDQQVESAQAPATVALLARPGAKGLRQRLLSALPPATADRRASAFRARARAGAEAGRPFELRLPELRPGDQFGQTAPAPRGAMGEPVPPPGAGGPGAFQLPPGTYGVLRNASGRTVSHVRFSYGESGLPAPALPDDFPVSNPDGPIRTFTIGARGGETDFRAVAFRPVGGSLTAVVAVPLNDFQDTLDHVALIGAIVTGSVLVGLGVLAWWLIRLGLRPLEEMGKTAGRIAAGDLSQRVTETNPRTEVGRLGEALNSMLGQIEGAFAQREASEGRMRRFLADASHELRTPLTSIRGYAEVFRIGAAHEPEELDKAMRRIEQESTRMSAMVNDLLALARLDEVREPVRERVDLRELVAEACEDARAASPDREIGFTARAGVEIDADGEQLRRVATNLLSNAAVHTPAGTPIEVVLRADDGTAVLSVRDHGPGLSGAAERQVFERFWRASESRGRDSGGAGLGLAIVAGVVEAHGGSVRAENHPAGGALFTVELPVEAAVAAGSGT